MMDGSENVIPTTGSLGDWKVNEEKITGGLKHLVDEVNKIGLQFGIWLSRR